MRGSLRSPLSSRPVSALLALALLSLPGCASVKKAFVLEEPPPRVSVKGYQLELAYGKDPAPPAPMPAMAAVIDTFVSMLVPDFVSGFELEIPPAPRRPRSAEPIDPCPPPTPSIVAERPITPNVKGVVEPGTYRWQNKGTIELVGLGKIPINALTNRTVKNVRTSGTATLFDTESVAGTLRFNHTYRVEPGSGIFLVALKTINGGASSTFNPAVPVKVFALPAVENTEFADVGVDPTTGTALVVEGTIQKKERIEGCDELVDGWFVDASWTFVRAGQQPSAWNYDYTVATQHGGLIIADRLQATETLGPLVVNIDASSAFGSIRPKAPVA